MFVFPALLSITLDATLVIVYFRQPELFASDDSHSILRLIDVTTCNFDLAIAAAFRILVLCPYIWSFVNRRRIHYAFLPWTWEAANMALVTARLVFLLSGLVPFDVQYCLVIISYTSILLQAACLEHLRSSAPREKRIFLAGAVNRVDASTRLLDPSSHPSSSTELYDGHQNDVDFIATITTKMKRAKEYWTGKTEALRGLWNDLSRTKDEQASPFNLLLRLFTYEDVLGEMDEAFVHDPSSIVFYIPQLVTFLLYGAFWSSASLQAFLLDKCSRSIQFAHRLYWYLNASCMLGSGINTEGVRQVTELIEEVKARGQKAAWQLEQGRTTQEVNKLAQGGHEGGESTASNESSRWSGTTRDSRERGASRGHPFSADGASTFIDIRNLNSGALPDTRQPASEEEIVRSAVFPFEAGAYKGTDGDVFGTLPSFINSLINMAQDLMIVPRDKRNASLRSGLDDLSSRYLPSNLIYMPVGNPYHRVWKIHSEESFSFSTKERVPCLVCLEVVDYMRPKKQTIKKKWWNMDNLPALSHTFRFGNKEWTLKIGEPKKDSDERIPSDSSYTAIDGLDTIQQQSTPVISSGGVRGMAATGSSSKHIRVGSYPNPTDVGGMGQWASKAFSGNRSASVDGGNGGDIMEIVQNYDASLHGEAREEPAPTFSASAYMEEDPLSHAPDKDSMREPLMMGDVEEESKGGKRRVRKGGRRRPHLELSEDKVDAGGAMEYREEKSPRGNGGNDGNRAGGATDDYGTFSPVPSPTYAERSGSSTGLPTIVEATTTIGGGGGREDSSTTKKVKKSGSIIRSGSNGGAVSPSATIQPPVIFKERWRQKEARIRKASEIGHLPNWRLLPVIIKANDDLRQEQFASQLLRQIEQIVREAEIPVWMRPYDIIATSYDGGLIEAIPDTVSLDALRRNDPHYTTLADFFERLFAQRGPSGLAKARQCFIESLAAYSIICFLLQIKDRHNGNILLDAEGHLIHIDFGFLLARSPGNVNFERAPFKLTSEFVEVMGGPRSACFKRFRDLCVKMYLELRRQRHKIILIVEMVVTGNENLPCFGGKPQAAVEALRQRFQPELNDRACMEYVNSLIDQSLDNWRTRWYDRYQSCFVGIA